MGTHTSIRRGATLSVVFAAAAGVRAGSPGCPEAGVVVSQVKISQVSGGFTGPLDPVSRLGISAANIGDLDGDGITDLAVGAIGGNGSCMSIDPVAIYILFMNADGTVRDEQKITCGVGGFGGTLDTDAVFGRSIANLGDLDGDGVTDLAVGANFADDGGPNRGQVWILFMNPDGTVRSHQKLASGSPGVGGINDDDVFGTALARLGDLDGDSVTELAVGVTFADVDGGTDTGKFFILFLNADGTSKGSLTITGASFGSPMDNGDRFGASLATLGDLDNDGVVDLAVGAWRDDDGGLDAGATYILFLNPSGTVKDWQKISPLVGGLVGPLKPDGLFGVGMAALGDLDGDGVTELAAGASRFDDGGERRGAVFVLYLNVDGTVKAERKISSTSGDFVGPLINDDQLGRSVANLGDLDGDGLINIAVGADFDDDGGGDQGAVWILDLDECAAAPPPCPGDADGSGIIDFGDLTSVLVNFGANHLPDLAGPGDANHDGVVNFVDITVVLVSFGANCP